MSTQTPTTHDVRALLLDEQRLAAEKAQIRGAMRALQQEESSHSPQANGVSVIVASYMGASRLGHVLNSLASQTLDKELFEVVVVLNGPHDGSRAVIADILQSHPAMEVRTFHRARASAGGARNLGIRLARRRWLTFVDDDDVVEPRFLEAGLGACSDNSIALLPMHDVTPEGTVVTDTSLAERYRGLSGHLPVASIPWVLGFNACKFVATDLARRNPYREDLRSGEDLVYFAALLAVPGLQVAIPEDVSRAAYLRALRPESVSRKALSEEFAVIQRLACIRELDSLELGGDSAADRARTALVRAQAGFIRRYLEESPGERDRVADLIDAAGVASFPWDIINREPAKHLAISYCFAPFSDTSAVVAAKAIAERELMVDVIANDMSKVRNRDTAVSALANRWVSSQSLVDAAPSFAGWDQISEFARKAVRLAEEKHALNGGYETMYTRALWSASHVAGAVFKLRHWQVRWTAEFSDPLRTDASGAFRQGEVTENDITRRLMEGLASRGFKDLELESGFALTEAATIALADELIFTNENQLEYMQSLWGSERIRQAMSDKAIIRRHPTPAPSAYLVNPTAYSMPSGVTNIGYFGSFYENRGVDEVLIGLMNTPKSVRDRLRLHIFCNRPAEVAQHVAAMGLSSNVYVNKYLSYMEFLNATTRFDYLLVNDVERGEDLPINPFLPSKLSDYRGSGSKVWAIVDPGSALSREIVDEVTAIGDAPGVVRLLTRIAG